MVVRILRGVVFCGLLVTLLCGCKSQHLVYKSSLDDTWYAAISAASKATGTACCNVSEKNHSLSTGRIYCGWESDNPFTSANNTSDNPESIKYATTGSRRDPRPHRTYWYATAQCRARDSGTEVIVSLQQGTEYSPPRADDWKNSDKHESSCPKADQWRDKFFYELSKQLGEPTEVNK